MMVNILSLVVLLCAVIGLFMLTQATAGVGIIAFGCAMGIIARLLQAKAYHQASQ